MPKKSTGRPACSFPKKLYDLRYVTNLSTSQFPCLKSESIELGQRSKAGSLTHGCGNFLGGGWETS